MALAHTQDTTSHQEGTTSGTKEIILFMQGLFPRVGIVEVRDHVEINRYVLLRLINSTHQLANSTMREKHGPAKTVLCWIS